MIQVKIVGFNLIKVLFSQLAGRMFIKLFGRTVSRKGVYKPFVRTVSRQGVYKIMEKWDKKYAIEVFYRGGRVLGP